MPPLQDTENGDRRCGIDPNHQAKIVKRESTSELIRAGDPDFEAVARTGKRVTTHLGILRDPEHAEPWIIAMAAKPGHHIPLGYADRWSIEPMVSDITSRGFGREQTHLRYPDRLAS